MDRLELAIISEMAVHHGQPLPGMRGMHRGFPLEVRGPWLEARSGSPEPRGQTLSLLDHRAFQKPPKFTWTRHPSVVEGSGMVRSRSAAAARLWLTRLRAGGLAALASSSMRRRTSRAFARPPLSRALPLASPSKAYGSCCSSLSLPCNSQSCSK
jgi:hypothetical protein